MPSEASVLVPAIPWHALPPEVALQELKTSARGLSEAEAARRLARDGPNRLPQARRAGPLQVFVQQFRSPLIYVLLFASAVSLLMRHWSDAAFVMAVVLANAIIGAAQEWKAESSAAALAKSLSLTPTVLRDGVRRVAPAESLVVGDVVLLESGAAVPADLRLLSSEGLRADESLLTGESEPVDKQGEALAAPDAAVGDRLDMAFAGTVVLAGRGAGLVCATGERTQLGSIAQSLAGAQAKPPLLLRMEAFSRRIGVATLAVVALLAAGEALRGAPLADVFLLAVALAVSAIPEGLPVAITIALSVASARMARRKVVVRRLPAVEGLGSCTLIATDKTGTLTENRLTIKRVWLPGGDAFGVGGEGLDLNGHIGAGAAERMAELTALAASGMLANEGALRRAGDEVEAVGDAVDVAFLVLGAKLGCVRSQLLATAPMVDSIPYEPERGYAASLHAEPTGRQVHVKGAPERVLAMCAGENVREAERAARALAAEGYRVLAVAAGPAEPADGALQPGDIRGLAFLGLVGLIDPLRAEVPDAIARCRSAGVEVRMITGDHPQTALAIARQLDPSDPPVRVLTGPEMKRLDGPALEEAILQAQVYARVEPTQKRVIVESLQRRGHFVALTGDGVNDAPALQAAHVGVAMGMSGTDVARGAADLILTDDNFASIVNGVEEGRGAYDNIRKIIWLLLSTAVAEVMLFLLCILLGLPMPLTPVQILWLNLVTEGLQHVSIALERPEPGVMARPPRPPRQPLFDRLMIEQCLLTGAYTAGVGVALFGWLMSQGYGEADARNLLLLFLVLFENVQALNCRSETRSLLRTGLSGNPILILAVVGAQGLHMAAMHLPPLQAVLGVHPVTLAEWGTLLGLASTVILLAEVFKRVRAARLAAAAFGPLRPIPAG